MRLHATLCGLVLSLISPAYGDVVLYDGSSDTTPNAQGWLYLTQPSGNSGAVQSAANGFTTLDTTAAQTDHAGYFSTLHPLMPTLNAATGYTVWLDVRVVRESHATNDRAGLSLIVLGSNHRGIELGFWENQVWAQSDNPLFTHAESALIDTTTSIRRYGVSVLGDSYSLYLAGQPILTGVLRDYSSFGTPYTSTNFIFLGDDTSSAQTNAQIARVAVNIAAIPEPASLWLLTLGLPVLCFTKKGASK